MFKEECFWWELQQFRGSDQPIKLVLIAKYKDDSIERNCAMVLEDHTTAGYLLENVMPIIKQEIMDKING